MTNSLLKLEPENYDPASGTRSQAYVLALSPMRAFVYALGWGDDDRSSISPDTPSIPDVEVLKASEQSLGQLLPPPHTGPAWISDAAELQLRARLIKQPSVPSAFTAPAMAVVPITAVDESKDGGGCDRRPGTPMALLRPHRMFGPRRSDGQLAIPCAIWREGLDLEDEWRDFSTGEELSGLHTGQARDGIGEQARVLTYEEVITAHFSKTPERMLGPDGDPVTGKTLGLLEAAPTTAAVVRIIGREMNSLDRTGLTQNPEYSEYTGKAEERRLVLRVLRLAGAPRVREASGLPERSVRRFVKGGRTSKGRWSIYSEAAVRIASEDLASVGRPLPATDEGRMRVFLEEGRRCDGCRAKLTGKQRRWCGWCRGRGAPPSDGWKGEGNEWRRDA